jgi:hypothetical protein
LSRKLEAAGVDILPLSHGNTLVLYFSASERNGLEVLWGTGVACRSAEGAFWDTSLNEREALVWVEAEFGDQPSFKQREVADVTVVNRN